MIIVKSNIGKFHVNKSSHLGVLESFNIVYWILHCTMANYGVVMVFSCSLGISEPYAILAGLVSNEIICKNIFGG